MDDVIKTGTKVKDIETYMRSNNPDYARQNSLTANKKYTIGDKIKEEREAQNMTQQDLAKMAGISKRQRLGEIE